jgi:putative inorganic carbon (HCO3(-)) transporter
MNSQDLLRPVPFDASRGIDKAVDATDTTDSSSQAPGSPPIAHIRLSKGLSPFWHDRLVETGLILSMFLYYLVGNENLGTGRLFHVNPLLSLPFLFIFALLCWYRLSFAVALLPLALPYYLQQKTVVSHYSFGLAEIALATCVVVALLQILFQQGAWRYRLSWQELRDRLGPFALPIIIFLLAAGISVFIAYAHKVALRAFREEVFDPILYLLLAMFCLRTRQDVIRLLVAMLGSGLLVAFLGIAQYFLFRNQLLLEADGVRRVHAMYGSANSIGLFFDYVLPIGLALIYVQIRKATGVLGSWWVRVLALVLCLSMLLVLYLSQSRGAWVAISIASLFILALSIRNRKVLLICGLALIALGVLALFFHKPLLDFLVGGHRNVNGVSTLTKRLYLWRSALKMIHDHPWFGVGMENWLCYYSYNSICFDPAMLNHHYWILVDPVTHATTGLQDEPTLSHPHNILLHVWVSMGIFGLLAFVAVLALFYRLFARILISLRSANTRRDPYLQWMTIGVGAAMLAALIQGLVDSSFLVQDLSFCFWMLVTALLLLRVLTGTTWRGRLRQEPRMNGEDNGGQAQVVPG